MVGASLASFQSTLCLKLDQDLGALDPFFEFVIASGPSTVHNQVAEILVIPFDRRLHSEQRVSRQL